MTQDHNLLFGVFAVQLNKVSPTQLMDVASAWASDTSRDIPSRLVALNILSEADQALLQRFVDEAVAAHGGDAKQTLASFGGEEQVHRTYQGSLVLTADGQVSIPPTARTPDSDIPHARSDHVSTVKGVFETPGRYTNSIEHARGGMGRVLLVHDDFLGRDIALKELLPHLGTTEGTTRDGNTTTDDHPSPVRFSAHILARFLQEARITGQLEHPSIVPVYELGHRKDGSLYYTMKLVRGRSLSKAIKECNTLEERLRLLPHFVDLCQAIAYAHSRGIIHRDIKPANVMVGEFGETVVLDWGLAKKRDREDVHERELVETLHAMNLGDEVAAAKTAYGQVLGTPVYMAPEQAKGDLDAVDEQSDVYSLGVVLYELLTGTVPFEGKSTKEILKNVIAGNRRPIEVLLQKNPSPELAAIADKAMIPNKDGRYADVKSLASDVERFQAGAMVSVHKYHLSDYLRRIWDNHRSTISLAAAALSVIAVLTIYFSLQLYQSRGTERQAVERAKEAQEQYQFFAYGIDLRTVNEHLQRGERSAALSLLLDAPERVRNWEWGLLYEKAVGQAKIIDQDEVYQMNYSSDEKKVHLLSGDGFKVFDLRKNEYTFSLRDLDGSDKVYADKVADEKNSISTFRVDSTAENVLLASLRYLSLWDLETQSLIARSAEVPTTIGPVYIASDGSRAYTLSNRISRAGYCELICWDLPSLEKRYAIQGSFATLYHPFFSSDYTFFVTKVEDNTIAIWDAEIGAIRARLGDYVSDTSVILDMSPTDRELLVRDRTNLLLWNLNNGSLIHSIEFGDGKEFGPVLFNRDGAKVICVIDNEILILRTDNGGVAARISLPRRVFVEEILLPKRGDLVVAILSNNMVRTWNLNSGEEIASSYEIQGEYKKATVGPDGSLFFVSTQDGDGQTLRIVELGPRKKDRGAGAFSPDSSYLPDMKLADTGFKTWVVSETGRYLMATLEDNSLVIWDLQEEESFIPEASGLGSLALNNPIMSSRGYLLANNLRTDSLEDEQEGQGNPFRKLSMASVRHALPELPRWEEVLSVHVDGELARAVTTYQDGENATTMSKAPDGRIVVWNLVSGERICEIRPEGEDDVGVDSIFSPDGTMLAVIYDQKPAQLVDIEHCRVAKYLTSPFDAVRDVQFSPNGKWIVSLGGFGSSPRVYHSSRTDSYIELEGHNDYVVSASFSNDSSRILTLAGDGIRVWGLPEGEQLNFISTASDLSGAKFSPDGSRIIGFGQDVRIWHAESGTQLLSFPGNRSKTKALEFSIDGTEMVTSDGRELNVFRAANWKGRDWEDNATRFQMARLTAQRVPSEKSHIRIHTPDSARYSAFVEILTAIAGDWTSETRQGERAFVKESKGKGLLFRDVSDLEHMGLPNVREGDLLWEIDGERVGTLAQAGELLLAFAESLESVPEHSQALSMALLNENENRRYHFVSTGLIERAVEIERDTFLQFIESLYSAMMEVSEDGNPSEPEDGAYGYELGRIPAEALQLKVGDELLEIDGRKTYGFSEVFGAIKQVLPLIRSGQQSEFEIVVRRRLGGFLRYSGGDFRSQVIKLRIRLV